jgi:hypothetical protein
MAKKKRKSSQSFMVPLVTYRTPEQHRAIIQPPRKSTPGVFEPRPIKSRAKRVRLAKAGTGTSSLGARMLALGLRNYSYYLATPHWLDVKRRWKESNMFKGWVCHSFGCDSRKGLSFHHWTYERVGREELTDLILVCDDCHSYIHALERKGMPLEDATRRVTKQRLKHAA